MGREFDCSSHTMSGVLPGATPPARFSLPARLEALARHGYSGAWLHHRDVIAQRDAGVGATAMRAMFGDAGIAARGVEFLTDWFVDTPAARAAEDAAFAAAAAIGAPLLSVGGDMTGRGIPSAEMRAAHRRLCARAAAAGIAIALEIVPWSNVADVDAALAYLDPPNAGLVVDCWHVFRGGIGLDALRRLPAERILCVQVNDAAPQIVGELRADTQHRLSCGAGSFDLAGFAATLDSMGVALPYAIEIISAAQAALPLDAAVGALIVDARRVFGGS